MAYNDNRPRRRAREANTWGWTVGLIACVLIIAAVAFVGRGGNPTTASRTGLATASQSSTPATSATEPGTTGQGSR
jgi:hypothetical protein